MGAHLQAARPHGLASSSALYTEYSHRHCDASVGRRHLVVRLFDVCEKPCGVDSRHAHDRTERDAWLGGRVRRGGTQTESLHFAVLSARMRWVEFNYTGLE